MLHPFVVNGQMSGHPDVALSVFLKSVMMVAYGMTGEVVGLSLVVLSILYLFWKVYVYAISMKTFKMLCFV